MFEKSQFFLGVFQNNAILLAIYNLMQTENDSTITLKPGCANNYQCHTEDGKSLISTNLFWKKQKNISRFFGKG